MLLLDAHDSTLRLLNVPEPRLMNEVHASAGHEPAPDRPVNCDFAEPMDCLDIRLCLSSLLFLADMMSLSSFLRSAEAIVP